MCTNTTIFLPSAAQRLVHPNHGDLLVADGVAKTYLRVEVTTNTKTDDAALRTKALAKLQNYQ